MSELGPRNEDMQDQQPMELTETQKMNQSIIEEYTPELTARGVNVDQIKDILDKMLDEADRLRSADHEE